MQEESAPHVSIGQGAQVQQQAHSVHAAVVCCHVQGRHLPGAGAPDHEVRRAHARGGDSPGTPSDSAVLHGYGDR